MNPLALAGQAFALILATEPGDVLSAPANRCITQDQMAETVSARYPGIEYELIDGARSLAVTRGMIATGALLSVTRRLDYLIGSRPDNPHVVIIGFIDGCYEGARIVPAELLSDWLRGLGSSGL